MVLMASCWALDRLAADAGRHAMPRMRTKAERYLTRRVIIVRGIVKDVSICKDKDYCIIVQ